MDVLTDVLSAIRLERIHYSRWELTAPWGIETPDLPGAGFIMMDQGQCWLKVAGQETTLLTAGDLVVLPRGDACVVADSLDTPPRDHEEIWRNAQREGLSVHWGGGGVPAAFICGMFHVKGDNNHPLLSLLPTLIHVRGDQGRANEWLDITLRFIAAEAGSPGPGSETIVDRMIDVLFVQAVRVWVDQESCENKGWLSALFHPTIGAALGLIHQSPERSWTVASLAEEVGMSRSAFAERFAGLVGEPPLQYITRWRMQMAINCLTDTNLSLQEISQRVGYQSESPFNKVFKRLMGVAPGAYRRQFLAAANGG